MSASQKCIECRRYCFAGEKLVLSDGCFFHQECHKKMNSQCIECHRNCYAGEKLVPLDGTLYHQKCLKKVLEGTQAIKKKLVKVLSDTSSECDYLSQQYTKINQEFTIKSELLQALKQIVDTITDLEEDTNLPEASSIHHPNFDKHPLGST